MEMENNQEKQFSKLKKLPILIMISVIVFIGICLVFIQFRTDRLPVIYLTHTDSIYTSYFELDNTGNNTTLDPVFNDSGFLYRLSGSDFLDSALESANDTTQGYNPDNNPGDNLDNNEEQRHRIGFSRIIFERLNYAKLVIPMHSDIRYIIYLDDVVLFSDFPDLSTALGASFDQGMNSEQHKRSFAQEISFDLPHDFTGMTLTVIEFIKPGQVSSWYPVIPQIETNEAKSLVSIMILGPHSVIAGCVAIVVIILTVLLALQMFIRKKTWWLLILPIIYGILEMIRIAFVEIYSGPQFWIYYDPFDFVNRLTYLCGGNLLLIFLAFKLNHRIKYGLAAVSGIHLIVSAWYLISNYIAFRYVYLEDMPWFAIFGLVCIIFAVVLMIFERKENRYFKICIQIIVAFVAGYILIMIITRFFDYELFTELAKPVSETIQLNFLPLNNLLSLMIVLLITISSIREYFSEIEERRLRSNASELANRMKIDFLGNISHELKNPLTSVSVLGKHSYNVISEDQPQSADDTREIRDNRQMIDELRDNLRIIVVDSDRMKRIIDGLLDVAAIEQNDFELHKEYFQIQDIIQEVGGVQFKALDTNENTLKFNFASNLPQLYADRERLKDVLINLLSNASKSTLKGTILITVKQERKKIMISIADNGTGIPEDMQKNLFKRFLGADTGRAHGKGLGLYISKQIIELHDGSIRLESKPGIGTTVYIDLPIKGAKQQ